MIKNTILYRGSLKSCNYHCSYCPFAKHHELKQELEKDEKQFMAFCESVTSRAEELSIGAVFITPYGEALIHTWYWEGLALLSKIDSIHQVGVQTNLSFSVQECLSIFSDLQGEKEKLRIWATFHPEMTTIKQFISQCRRLMENEILFSVGTVGVPDNIELIKALRQELPKSIYLWINKMDGLKRPYTSDEINVFMQIDPFFKNELCYPKAFAAMCQNRCFVKADGRLHTCNISKVKTVNWYTGTKEEIFKPLCSNSKCSCYLAYAGRTDFASKNQFGDYPLFRIPEKSKDILLD